MANQYEEEERSMFERLINAFGPLRDKEEQLKLPSRKKLIEDTASDEEVIRAIRREEQLKAKQEMMPKSMPPHERARKYMEKYPLTSGDYPAGPVFPWAVPKLPFIVGPAIPATGVDPLPLSWLEMDNEQQFELEKLRLKQGVFNPPPIPSPSIEADIEKMETALKKVVAEHHVMKRIIELVLDFNTNVYDNMNPGGKIFPSVSLRSVATLTYKLEFQIVQESGLLNKELFSAVRECNIRGLSEDVVKAEITALLVDALLHLMSLSLYKLVSTDDSVSL